MPEFLAPGIYLEELTAQPHPIQGVSTTTAGFIRLAPGAGTPAGVPLIGVAGVSPHISQALGRVLGSTGIHQLRFIPVQRNQISDGATRDPEWKYVNIRRLALFIEQSLVQGSQWAVFEPNGPALWAALSSSIEGFLLNLWRSGSLHGSK